MPNNAISVVYVDEQGHLFERALSVSIGCTLAQAIEQSGFSSVYPSLNIHTLNFGVYSLRRLLSDAVHDGDRVEIYRPLLIDPKDRRRQTVDAVRNPKKWRRIATNKP